MLVVKKGTEDERIASVADTTPRRLWAKAAFLLERLEIYLRNGRLTSAPLPRLDGTLGL